MRTKAMRDLCQLGDEELFANVSEGLGLILENAVALDEGAEALVEQGHSRASAALDVLLEEEAAKFLILMDAVRCPRQPPKLLAGQLKRCYDHLAKSVYSEVYAWRPATYGEVAEGIRKECEPFYLDGPMGYDWIFASLVGHKREQALYVDYVHGDEAHFWEAPPADESFPIRAGSSALDVAKALWACGCCTPEGLEVVAEIWRPQQFDDATEWAVATQLNLQTIGELERRGLLAEHSQDACRIVVHEWMFPLHAIEVCADGPKVSELREEQERRFYRDVLGDMSEEW